MVCRAERDLKKIVYYLLRPCCSEIQPVPIGQHLMRDMGKPYTKDGIRYNREHALKCSDYTVL